MGEILRAPLKHIVMSFHGGNLDALVTYILEQLNERFFVGETVEIQGTAARPYVAYPHAHGRYKAEVLEVLAAGSGSHIFVLMCRCPICNDHSWGVDNARFSCQLPPVPCNYVVQRIGSLLSCLHC